MARDDIRQRFLSLRIWRQHGALAPYKPLLLLLAIGRCLRGEDRLIPYREIRGKLVDLLRAFAPYRKEVYPEDPFWRLRRDDVWEVERADRVEIGSRRGATNRSLIDNDIRAGLLPSDYEAFQDDHLLAMNVAVSLLCDHFDDTLHADILQATGIVTAGASDSNTAMGGHYVHDELEVGVYESYSRLRRSVAFRKSVVHAYGERCAVCEFAVRLPARPLALEAAHIRWHCASGPSHVSNGLALCSLHHRLFDGGAFTVRPDLSIAVAGEASGQGVDESLKRFAGRRLHGVPGSSADRPDPEHLSWHGIWVFKGLLAA